MMPAKRITVPSILQRKGSGEKIAALTAYDYTMAKLLDRAGIDVILVGDSVATVCQGRENTLPVTLEEMIYHCRCVAAGVKRALLVADMPFLSYQPSIEKAVESAGRLLKEGGAAAVKLEGGVYMASTIEKLTNVDIPVMGHVGLTPQSFHRMGGHRQQGRFSDRSGAAAGSRERIIEDALAVESAGAFALVIEGVPGDLAAEITRRLSIPTIGIGAGDECDGQILVTNDMLGMDPDFCPSFVKQYANLAALIEDAVGRYRDDVRSSGMSSVRMLEV